MRRRLVFLIALSLVVTSFLWAGALFAQTDGGQTNGGAAALPSGPSAATPPMIILIGAPMSGKTTFAGSITQSYGIPSISVEDLINENAKELHRLHPEGLELAEMRTDPAMSRYVRGKFQDMDLSHGVALDGYPATLAQSEELATMVRELHMYPLIFQLNLPDEVIRARAKKTGQASDNPKIIAQRIKDYRREMEGIGHYFPNAKLVPVDVHKPEADSWKAIQAAMDGAGIKAK
jgi:adenylate kinase family enzyme